MLSVFFGIVGVAIITGLIYANSRKGTPEHPLWKKGDKGFRSGDATEPFTVVRIWGNGMIRVRYTGGRWRGAVVGHWPDHLRKSATHFHAQNRSYGWHRSGQPSPHPLYQIPEQHRSAANLPASIDLRPECPSVYDQLSLGSCTANALAGLVQFLLMKRGLPSFVPSRLFIYFNERAIEGSKDQDSGASGDDGVTSLLTKGVPPETDWPYDVERFTRLPPPAAWAVATRTKLADPVTIPDGDLHSLKSRLASGYPVAFGFTAYESLESRKVGETGLLPMPKKGETELGGHEVLAVGYDDAERVVIVRNSWGPSWGIGGHFKFPYDYISNPKLASDFRSASLVS